MNLEDLKKPFASDQVKWRVGSATADKKRGMALAYIDARNVQDRLDDVCGQEGWQNKFENTFGERVLCSIGIKVSHSIDGVPTGTGEWVWKSDGAGPTEFEADKGGLSDAFKRAAVQWGVGRYLYNLSAPWVEIEKAGKSYKIAPQEFARLKGILDGRGNGDGATPHPAPSPDPAHPSNGAETEINTALVCDLEKIIREENEGGGLEAVTALVDKRKQEWFKMGGNQDTRKAIAAMITKMAAELDQGPA